MATGRPRGWRDPAKERRWRRVVRDWQASGLSVRQFCRRQGLSEPSFYAWRRELAVTRKWPSGDNMRIRPVNTIPGFGGAGALSGSWLRPAGGRVDPVRYLSRCRRRSRRLSRRRVAA